MSRALWFVAGTSAGVYAAVRAKRVAEALSIEAAAHTMDVPFCDVGINVGTWILGRDYVRPRADR